MEEGGGGEEERRESLWPTLNVVLFQGQPHTHWNGYTKTELKQATYNVLFHWKVRIALQKMLFSRFIFSITAAIASVSSVLSGVACTTWAILTCWRCDNGAHSFIDFGVYHKSLPLSSLYRSTVSPRSLVKIISHIAQICHFFPEDIHRAQIHGCSLTRRSIPQTMCFMSQ